MLQRELRQDPASEGTKPSPPDSSQVRKELMTKLGAVQGPYSSEDRDLGEKQEVWLESLIGANRGRTRLSQVKGAANSRCRAVEVTGRKGCMPARSLLLCRPGERACAEAECHGCKLGSSGHSAAAGARRGRQLGLKQPVS